MLIETEYRKVLAKKNKVQYLIDSCKLGVSSDTKE